MVPGGTAQSSSSSGISFEGDVRAQVVGNSQPSSNLNNSSSSFPGHALENMGPLSGDVSNRVLHSVTSSDPSVGASSLVTDANSGLSGGPHLQRSASVNTESYAPLPASPMSFSSNNISISGTPVMDGFSVVQQSSNQDPGSQHAQQNQHQGLSSATSLPRMGKVQFPGGARVPYSFVQDPTTMSQPQKKRRLDNKQEDVVHQQVLQQLLPMQNSMHLQNSSPQLQASIEQQRLGQQEQHVLQAIPSLQRAQLLQQQQQLRQVKRHYDGGVCSRQLMQYLHHQRQRPADNTIAYLRALIAEYFSPHAKMRWCLSLYDNVGHHSRGVFPQAAVVAWQCDICGSKSGKGFETTFEVLPRLDEIKFASGVIDELLFLDLPCESKFPSGIMMLECAKAVQESVYENLRVVREGQLRVLFTPDLKILSWEFCAQHHEELLPRKFVAPQANRLLQVAQKWQSMISEGGADGISQAELQANSAMVVTAGRQLARRLELQSLNDLGFSKRYVRSLQTADVVNSMKDLMDFCRVQKKGPIEGLKSFSRCPAAPGVQLQETDQIGGLQGLPSNRNTLNKLIALQPGLNSQIINQHEGGQGGVTNGSAHSAVDTTNYQNLLMRQNSIKTNGLNQHERSSSSNTSNRPMSNTPGSSGAFPGMLQNTSGGFSGSQAPQQQQQLQLQPPNGNGLTKQSQSPLSQENQSWQHQMIQQSVHDTSKNNVGIVMQQHFIQHPGNCISGGGLGIRNSAAGNGPGVSQAHPSSISNSASHLPEIPHSMLPSVDHQFIEDGFIDNILDECIFNWKE